MRRVVARVGVGVAITLGLLTLLLATGVLKPYAIATSAMEPTLHCARPAPGCQAGRKDRVLVTSWSALDRGDLVVFDAPPEAVRRCGAAGKFVKRIIGLPDEVVELRLVRGRERVYIHGELLEEPYVEEERRGIGLRRSWTLGSASYLVLGDNRLQSCDSRMWGALDAFSVDGEVVAIYWPLDRITIR